MCATGKAIPLAFNQLNSGVDPLVYTAGGAMHKILTNPLWVFNSDTQIDVTATRVENAPVGSLIYVEDRAGKAYGKAEVQDLPYPDYFSDIGIGNVETRVCIRFSPAVKICTEFVN